MSDYKDIFRTKESQIFCKAWTAVHIARDGLVDFVDKEFHTFHNRILPTGFNCMLCTTEHVLESNRLLPCQDHGHIRDAIHQEHRFSKPRPRFSGPSWINIKPENWTTSSWDVAKCFMPATGYLDKATAAETDFNGIIGAVINCKSFEKLFTADLSQKNNICTEVRDKLNKIRHFKNMEPGITDADLNDNIDVFIKMLNDTKSLQGDLKATDARDKLNKLKLDTLVITTEEAGKILEDALNEFKKFHTAMDSTKQDALKEIKDMLDDAHKRLTDKGAEEEKKLSDVGAEQEKKLSDAGTEQIHLINQAGDMTMAGLKNNISEEVGTAKKELEAEKDKFITDVEFAGKHETKAATEKIKIAAQVEESRVKEAGQMVKQDVEKAIEHVTKAATEKIKLVGQMEESHVKDAGQLGESRVKDAGQKEENRVKDAGQKEESRVQDAGQMVKQDVEKVSEHISKAATEKIKIAGQTEESHVKDAGQKEENRVKDAGQMEESRVKDAGQMVKQDVEKVSEHITKAATEKIKIAGQTEESHVKDAGQVEESRVKDAGQKEENRVKETGKRVKLAIKEETETACGIIRDTQTEVMSTQQNKTEDEIYEERKRELRYALAHHYLTEHDSLPLSPLMPEVDDKLIKFYMAPKMNKVDTKSSTNSVQTTEHVESYKSMFYKDNNLHKNIYIQGEAGIGKSTFCTKLGQIWSKKYCTEKKLTERSKKGSSVNKETREFSDVSIIYEFDFVFSLALRNVEGECEIGKMIQTQIISELTDDEKKYAGLVPEILDKERCLIILDGLDEWSHQLNCKKSRRSLVPHRKSWCKTTVLTSTRPWKMNEVRLKDSEISTLIQVTGITNSETFIENVLNCLNDKYNKTLDVKDFLRYIRDKKLKHFLDIPVIAMQLLWLWHSGHKLGDSKCQIYMNMLDMLFGRVEEKSPSACDDITDSSKVGLPPCFESTEFCEQHKVVLDWLASLAFHTLFSSKREETLVFSESMVKNVKSTAALKTALKTGILSQHKSPSRNKRTSHFSFLHKTFQEFLAAYFIATHEDESENIVQTLFQVYGQTVDIMDISELFIFVCGLNTEMSCKISDSVMKSFSDKLTNHIEELHVSGSDYNVSFMTLWLQDMILAGYKESISNGHQDPQLALHHVYYSHISGDDKIYWNRLMDRNIDKVVRLSACWCAVDVVKIQQILTQSSSTLTHVSLLSVRGPTDASLDLFTNITLKSLHLCHINTHFDIKLNTSSLLYCYLDGINKEVEHSVLSALTTAPKLHTLELTYCKNMSVLCQVLPTLPMLHTLEVHERMIPASLCQVMSTLSQLQRLTVSEWQGCEDRSLLCQLPSTLSNLQYIKLKKIDLGDNDILLPNSIQEIVLCNVELTCRSFRQLVDRLTQIPHKVTCTLRECTVRTEQKWVTFVWDSDEKRLRVETEWYTIVKHIQQSHMFEIHQNDITLQFTKI